MKHHQSGKTPHFNFRRLSTLVGVGLVYFSIGTSLTRAEEPSTEPEYQSFTSSAKFTARPLDRAKLNHIKGGMTLKQIVDELGLGWMSTGESTGHISWFFSDGRHLTILPTLYEPTEVINADQIQIESDAIQPAAATRPATTQR